MEPPCRPVLVLSVIYMVMLHALCVTAQTYVARRVPALDDVVVAETNVFTVPCTSPEECVMLCGELKAGCLSVVYNSNNNFCRGYPVVFDSSVTTFSSPGAEFYALRYAPCPYDAGYLLYKDVCLRAVLVEATDVITWYQADALCAGDGGSLFAPSNTAEEITLISFLEDAVYSGVQLYHLGIRDSASDQCLEYTRTIKTFALEPCSTYLQGCVCVV